MRLVLSIVLIVTVPVLYGQNKIQSKISDAIVKNEATSHLTFLAADEMRGRYTGSPELDIAANYLATQFRILGARPHSSAPDFFQVVELEKIIPPTAVSLRIDTTVFRLRDDIVVMSGGSISLEKELVFIGYGAKEDFEKADVNDKIVVTFAGTPESKSPRRLMHDEAPAKELLAQQYHAAALVEIMTLPGVPWQTIVNNFSKARMNIHEPGRQSLPHFFMRNTESETLRSLQQTKRARGRLDVVASQPQIVRSENVIGLIEGTDARLKNEWIAITAHYDHIGVMKNSSPDSIYNGARDNAIGTVGLLEAAKFFAANPPKRSLLLVAFTGEEMGMLGSAWYAAHPAIPLNQTVFDFNGDGGGYNDKTIATIIDFNRTTSDELLKKGCEAYGLILKGDPAPEQNLYERSDNMNFAAKGVPAVNFSPGVKAFDPDVLKYYHQPADEVGTLDMDYLEKFYRSFIYCIYLIANDPERPHWKSGDKFESAAKALYAN
ncbi:MAG TPA: M28 family peptidase [Chryseolinea sp.]|nr:M28 family peptidase [Chryseolinea sp.]